VIFSCSLHFLHFISILLPTSVLYSLSLHDALPIFLTIFLLLPSIRAILPSSRRVTENRLGRSRLFICRVGRSSGLTSTFQVSRMVAMPHSGGVGGSCWM